jgi:hypothetical protein
MMWPKLTLCAVAALCLCAWAARPPANVQELKQRVEKESGKDQIKLCIEIADAQLQNAEEFYKNGYPEKARVAIEDVVTYGERAASVSASTGKHMKPTEQAVHKITHRIEGLERAVEFEERATLKAAGDKLEKAHTDLLTKMFAK